MEYIKNYKIDLCKNYEEKGKCKYGDKCRFAHGNHELRKKSCKSYEKCWNDKCTYEHPEGWDPYENKRDCDFCKRGFCDKKNNKYKHFKDVDNENVNNLNQQEIKEELFNFEEEFPEIVKNKNDYNKDYKKYEYTYSEILKGNEIINIKDENVKEGLNSKEWTNYDEIEKTEERIKISKDNESKKEDMFIENNNNSDENYESHKNYNIFSDVKLKVNRTEVNNIVDDLNINIKDDNIEVLIENMKKELKKYNVKIKENINNTIKDDNIKYVLLSNLNEISAMMDLFINSYTDIININK